MPLGNPPQIATPPAVARTGIQPISARALVDGREVTTMVRRVRVPEGSWPLPAPDGEGSRAATHREVALERLMYALLARGVTPGAVELILSALRRASEAESVQTPPGRRIPRE